MKELTIRFKVVIDVNAKLKTYEWSPEYSMKDILKDGLDENKVIEDMEEAYIGNGCSCFNESQNHCECAGYYFDASVVDLEITSYKIEED